MGYYMGVSENSGHLIWGVLIIRILLCGVLYGSFRKFGAPYLGGPYNKDPTIWGTIWEFPKNSGYLILGSL